jgi:DHA1 family multidrug resistance protein-like MFS transporter
MNASETSRHDPGPQRTHWFQLGVICAASFVVWSGFGAILPYLPVFLQEQAHASVWLIGVVAAAYYVGTFACSVPAGRLSDSIGRKPVIIAGVALYAIASALFVSTTHPGWFILFRMLEGIGAAAVTPAGQALVADLSTEETRSRAYGWLTTAQFGGLVAGPLLAVPLYNLGGGQGTWAFYAIFLFGSALSAVTALVLLFAIREPEHARRRRQTKVKRAPYRQLITKAVAAFLIVAFTGHFAMGVWEVLWSLWLRHLGASMSFVSWTWVAFSLPMLLSFMGGYFADRHNRWALMFSGYVVSALAWITYGLTTNLTLFLIVSVIEGFAVAWSYPAKAAFLVQVVPPRWLGTVQGIEQSFIQVAGLVGTLVAPLLYDYLSGYVIALAGVVSLVGLCFAGPILYKEWGRLRDVRDEEPAGCASEKKVAPEEI